ncbi:MAG: hypothetical protein WBP64_21640 [Nitrososphaeraceae archaeon]
MGSRLSLDKLPSLEGYTPEAILLTYPRKYKTYVYTSTQWWTFPLISVGR